jgi:hypothetical protein
MAIGLGLGLEFGLTAIGFAMIYVASRESYIYQMLGKYGFILTTLLAVYQTNIDAAAGAPVSLGLGIMLLTAILIIFMVIDTAYFFYLIIPRRKGGESWNKIIFGRG